MSRAVMLEKIRRCCSRARRVRQPLLLPEFPVYEDRVDTFRQELKRVGGDFFEARREDQLEAALSVVLRRAGATAIYWESEEIFQKHGIPYRLRNPEAFAQGDLVHSSHFGGRVKMPIILNAKRYERENLATVTLSASSALCGIAETASVLQPVGIGKGRLFCALPPAHLVFLSEKDLLNNHAECFTSIRLGQKGSALTLVTGPSRTADIEKTLVVGVHGPGHWSVILTG